MPFARRLSFSQEWGEIKRNATNLLVKQTHCERIPSAQTREPFSTSATLSTLTDLLADQNSYRKIQLIRGISPRVIVIPSRKGFFVRHVSIDVPPHISNVF